MSSEISNNLFISSEEGTGEDSFLQHKKRSNETGYNKRGEEEFEILIFPFGIYEIHIKLGENDKFLGVKKIKLKKDFLTNTQRSIAVPHRPELDKHYLEDEDEE